MQSKTLPALAAASLLSAGSLAHAAVLASYTFTDTRVSGDENADTVATDVANGAGITSTIYAQSGSISNVLGIPYSNTAFVGPIPSSAISGSNTVTLTAAQQQSVETDVVTPGTYLSFTLNNGGNEVDLTSLTFQLGRFTTQASGRPLAFVRTSVDNFAANVGPVYTSASQTALTNANIDLTAAAYQNLTGPVEFRLYFFESATSGSDQNVANRGGFIDNLTLNGDVTVVPEPATLAVLGLGGLAMLRRRRA